MSPNRPLLSRRFRSLPAAAIVIEGAGGGHARAWVGYHTNPSIPHRITTKGGCYA